MAGAPPPIGVPQLAAPGFPPPLPLAAPGIVALTSTVALAASGYTTILNSETVRTSISPGIYNIGTSVTILCGSTAGVANVYIQTIGAITGTVTVLAAGSNSIAASSDADMQLAIMNATFTEPVVIEMLSYCTAAMTAEVSAADGGSGLTPTTFLSWSPV